MWSDNENVKLMIIYTIKVHWLNHLNTVNSYTEKSKPSAMHLLNQQINQQKTQINKMLNKINIQ